MSPIAYIINIAKRFLTLEMRYEFSGDNLQFVNVIMSEGESLDAATGSVAYTKGDFDVGKSSGGVLGGIKKALSGATVDALNYSPGKGVGTIGLGGRLPGKMMDINVEGMGWVAQRDAFIASQPTVRSEQEYQKKLCDAYGEGGLVLIKFTGKGMLFLFSLGDYNVFALQKGEEMTVATDKAAAWETSVKYKIEVDKSLKSTFRGKEGPYVTTFTGPGRIVVQSMSLQGMMDAFVPLIPEPETK